MKPGAFKLGSSLHRLTVNVRIEAPIRRLKPLLARLPGLEQVSGHRDHRLRVGGGGRSLLLLLRCRLSHLVGGPESGGLGLVFEER